MILENGNIFNAMGKKSFSYLILSLTLILLNACSTFQSDRSLVQKQIDSLLVSDFFKSSQAAISVYDLTNKKAVYNLNEKLLMRPASNQKIITTSTALKFLGPDYKFSTNVFHSGDIKDSVCLGDLYVVGGFDPDFTSKDLDSLCKQVRKFGIKEIKGNLYGDVSAMDSMYWGNGWMWDDDPDSYMPYLSPLTINKNCVTVVFEPDEIGKPAKVRFRPIESNFPIVNISVTVSEKKSRFAVTRDWMNKRNIFIATGNLPFSSKPDSLVLNIVKPQFNFLNLMNKSLHHNGAKLDGLVDTGSIKNPVKKIFGFERDIKRVIVNTNKPSDNLNAELLIRAVANKYFGRNASFAHGKILIDSLITLAGMNPKKYKIADGSGLSMYNLVSAELLTSILKYIYETDSTIKKEFVSSLPIAGVDGTLSNRFKDSPAKRHVSAKTGSVSGVSTLSGFVETASGSELVFSILIQNYVGGSAVARSVQDKICEILYKGL